MSDSLSPKNELRHSLRRLVKGLAALFWGLPLALIVCVKSAVTLWLTPLGIFPPVAATCILLYGVFEMQRFRKHAPDWQKELNAAKLFALVNVGLAPFVILWNRLPHVEFFNTMVWALGVTGALFIWHINRALRELADSFPDETLREEIQVFTKMNLRLIAVLGGAAIFFIMVRRVDFLPRFLQLGFALLSQIRLLVLLTILAMPLAMTMTLAWKIKEAALVGVFEQDAEDYS